jgi:hypothetical protein
MPRISPSGFAASRLICRSSVRALHRYPRPVNVLEGRRYRATSKARARSVRR